MKLSYAGVAGVVVFMSLSCVYYNHRLSSTEADLAASRATADKLEAAMQVNQQAIDKLAETLGERAEQEARLMRSHDKLQAKYRNMRTELGALREANAALRDWGATSVPSDVVRMYSRGDCSDAASCSERVPVSNGMLPASTGATGELEPAGSH